VSPTKQAETQQWHGTQI